MADARLGAINLNLLTALDALLAEGTVTRAAARTGVTQSAMSHSLRQLREMLGDPLFVRGPSGMVPTARAAAMREPVRRGLVDLSRALASADFDPREAERTFTLSSADFVSALLLPPLLEVLLRQAPGVDLNVRPADAQRDIHLLEAGELDAATLVAAPERSTLRRVRLFTESFACLVRRDHPDIGDTLSLETYARLSHALVSPRGSGPSFVDNALAERGLSRRIALRIPFFLAAPMIIARSDLILTAPRRVALQFAEILPLRVIEPPLPLSTFAVHLVWHERDDADPAHTWLRKAICRAAETATAKTASAGSLSSAR